MVSFFKYVIYPLHTEVFLTKLCFHVQKLYYWRLLSTLIYSFTFNYKSSSLGAKNITYTPRDHRGNREALESGEQNGFHYTWHKQDNTCTILFVLGCINAF